MPLTDLSCKTAKPSEKPRKLYDGKGLYLEVAPNQSKYWRFKYRFGDKEKRLALGVYPEVSLPEARNRRDAARKLLEKSIDPGVVKKTTKRQLLLAESSSFESLAREWHALRQQTWSARHGFYVLRRLETYIFPKIGSAALHTLTAPDLLAALRVIEKKGAINVAHRVLQSCGQVLRYAMAIGKTDRNIAADLKGALGTAQQTPYPALQQSDLPAFLRALDGYRGEPETIFALRLLVLTFVRTTELRAARWSEFHLTSGMWQIPKERMKNGQEHRVPLSRQALAILKKMKPFQRGDDSFVFPNQINSQKPMSQNTLLYALHRMGYRGKATGHGFRTTASTLLNEAGFSADVIERQLAHVDSNKIRARYNKAEYLPERKRMMQYWADTLDDLKKDSGKVKDEQSL